MKKLLVSIGLVLMVSNAQPPSLPNLGNSCYMNAALQCLLNIQDFSNFLKNNTNNPTTTVVALYQNYLKNPTEENLQELYLEVQIHFEHAGFINWLNTVLYKAFLVTPFDMKALDNVKNIIKKEINSRARNSFEKKFLKSILTDLTNIHDKIKAYEKNIKHIRSLVGDIGFVTLIPDESKVVELKKKLIDEPFKEFLQQKNTIFEIEFRNALRKKAPKCGQQDIHELMTQLLNIFMKDGLVGAAIQKKIQYTQQSNFIECENYNTPSKDIETQRDEMLVLGLWNDSLQEVNPSLQACLADSIFSKLYDYKVQGVVQKECIKKNLFEDIADYLIISLNRRRISLDVYGNLQDIKLNDSISIPLHLDMTPYIAPSKQDTFNPVYELTSVAVHKGGTGGGHYIAYVKDESDNAWYECNDDVITKIDDITAQQEIEKGYIFFYKSMPETLAKKFLIDQRYVALKNKIRSEEYVTKLGQALASLG